jgi:hypothetical protein
MDLPYRTNRRISEMELFYRRWRKVYYLQSQQTSNGKFNRKSVYTFTNTINHFHSVFLRFRQIEPNSYFERQSRIHKKIKHIYLNTKSRVVTRKVLALHI